MKSIFILLVTFIAIILLGCEDVNSTNDHTSKPSTSDVIPDKPIEPEIPDKPIDPDIPEPIEPDIPEPIDPDIPDPVLPDDPTPTDPNAPPDPAVEDPDDPSQPKEEECQDAFDCYLLEYAMEMQCTSEHICEVSECYDGYSISENGKACISDEPELPPDAECEYGFIGSDGYCVECETDEDCLNRYENAQSATCMNEYGFSGCMDIECKPGYHFSYETGCTPESASSCGIFEENCASHFKIYKEVDCIEGECVLKSCPDGFTISKDADYPQNDKCVLSSAVVPKSICETVECFWLTGCPDGFKSHDGICYREEACAKGLEIKADNGKYINEEVECVIGTVRVSNDVKEVSMPNLKYIFDGYFLASNWDDVNSKYNPIDLEKLDLSSLKECHDIKIYQSNLSNLNLPVFKNMIFLDINSNPNLKTIQLPNLEGYGYVEIEHNPQLESLTLEKLETARSLEVNDNKLLKTISLPKAEAIGDFGDIEIKDNPELISISLPMLKNSGEIEIWGNDKLNMLDISKLEKLDYAFSDPVSDLTIHAKNLTTLDLSLLQAGDTIKISESDLSELKLDSLSSVDELMLSFLPKLKTVALPKLSEFKEYISFYENETLQNIEFNSTVTGTKAGATISFSNNPLIDCTFLCSLSSIFKDSTFVFSKNKDRSCDLDKNTSITSVCQ